VVGRRVSVVLQVFLRYYHADELNASLQTSVQLVVTCQAYVRGLVARRQYELELRRQAEMMQEMCCELQRLVAGTAAQLSRIQRQHCVDDRKTHIDQVSCLIAICRDTHTAVLHSACAR